MFKKYNFLVIVFLIVLTGVPLIASASITDGVIDTDNKYAWGENIGWIDFLAPGGNVHIYDLELVGYVWGENIGWISLNCKNTNSCDRALYKVSNNSEGDLSGYAWGENIGWLDFSNIAIDASGEFSGYIWGENIGWISLSCENTNSCDTVDYKIKTDWRPQSLRKPVNVLPNDLSKLLALRYIETEQDITATEKVVFKVETRANIITKKGQAEVVVPDSTEMVKSDGEKMDVTKLVAEDLTDTILEVEDQNVVSSIQYGIPGESLTFSKPITVTMPIDHIYNDEVLHVYTSKNATSDWEFLTKCPISNGTCVFKTTSASYFAVIKQGGGSLPPAASRPPTSPSGGFNVLINNGDEITHARQVTLKFRTESDVTSVSISNYSDFNDAIVQNYTPTKEWDVCSKEGGIIIPPGCAEGLYTVYVKFYNQWGSASEIVSDSIIYEKLEVPAVILEPSPPVIARAKPEAISFIPSESFPPVISPPPLSFLQKQESSRPPYPVVSPSPVIASDSDVTSEERSNLASEPVVSEESISALSSPALGEDESAQEELMILYERATTSPNVLVAAVSNIRLMYGEITQSFFFTTMYVFLLLILLFVLGKEVRRWHIG